MDFDENFFINFETILVIYHFIFKSLVYHYLLTNIRIFLTVISLKNPMKSLGLIKNNKNVRQHYYSH